ncbi:hypothetical protein [Rothia dentocariosa]|uniref:hypothetical protein n=1 Tax=Rothia dentocariosa TaxID=2047 RepID=UPI0028E9345E|nr:hypothetical protein [Rothia dentocariosa]
MKTARMIGAIAALFLILGIGLFALTGWGAVVEYHALEWRSVQPKGPSPLTQAAATLAVSVLCVGFLTTIITFIMFFIIVIKNVRKKRSAHLGQTS